MAVCENCKQNFDVMRLSFYKDGIKAMKESRIGLLPDEIFDSIVKSVFPKSVTLHFTYKTRCSCPACWSPKEYDNSNASLVVVVMMILLFTSQLKNREMDPE